MKWWKRIKEFVSGRPAEPPPKPRPRIQPWRRTTYTGRGSRTRDQILRILSDGRPQTRKMIEAHLDVKTAAIHLPLMEKDGLIESEYLSRCKWYRLVKQPMVDLGFPVGAVDPQAPHGTE